MPSRALRKGVAEDYKTSDCLSGYGPLRHEKIAVGIFENSVCFSHFFCHNMSVPVMLCAVVCNAVFSNAADLRSERNTL